MARTRKQFWPGFVVGVLVVALATGAVVLLVPQLRQLIGLAPGNDPTPPGTVTNELPPVHNESANIKVTAPEAYATVTSPLTVEGEARVFENVVSLRLLDANGNVLVGTNTTAQSPDVGQFGPFSVDLPFDHPTGTTGTLEVFTTSAKDGSEIDKVTLPVRF